MKRKITEKLMAWKTADKGKTAILIDGARRVGKSYVAEEFVAGNHVLYFYSNPSKTDKASRMEIDFLISKSRTTNRHNISPIEVKSGKNYTLSSMNKFRKKYAGQLHTAFVLHTNDLNEKDDIVYLPVYMTPLI